MSRASLTNEIVPVTTPSSPPPLPTRSRSWTPSTRKTRSPKRAIPSQKPPKSRKGWFRRRRRTRKKVQKPTTSRGPRTPKKTLFIVISGPKKHYF